MSVERIPQPVDNGALLVVAPVPVETPVPLDAIAPVAAPVSTPAHTRPRLSIGLARMASPIVSIGLFAAGIALGIGAFWAIRPAPPVANAALDHVDPPAVVREFITSLKTNDADATRAVLGAAPYGLLAGELQQWGYQEVADVETLGTFVEGTASSTAIVLHGHDSNSRPLISNLIVQVEGGAIVSFR